MNIRLERIADHLKVREVNQGAFDSNRECVLVEALRTAVPDVLSLVADSEGTIVGHIMFSPVTMAENGGLNAMAVGPMAVAPAWQGLGVGGALVSHGIKECRLREVVALFVIGLPDYFPRFGFTAAASFGISCEFDVPPETFLALELVPGALSGRRGRVVFHAAFKGRGQGGLTTR